MGRLVHLAGRARPCAAGQRTLLELLLQLAVLAGEEAVLPCDAPEQLLRRLRVVAAERAGKRGGVGVERVGHRERSESRPGVAGMPDTSALDVRRHTVQNASNDGGR